MAKTFKAVTMIKHGNDDGTVVVFAVGEVVKGLSKEAMKALWDAGALEIDGPEAPEVPTTPEPKDEPVVTPVTTPTKAATTSTTPTGLAAPKTE